MGSLFGAGMAVQLAVYIPCQMIVFVFILAMKLKMFCAIRASEDARSVSSSSKKDEDEGGDEDVWRTRETIFGMLLLIIFLMP